MDTISHNAWLLRLSYRKPHDRTGVAGDERGVAFPALSIFPCVCLFVFRSLHLSLLCIGSLPHFFFFSQTDGAAGKCGQRSQLCSSHYSLSLSALLLLSPTPPRPRWRCWQSSRAPVGCRPVQAQPQRRRKHRERLTEIVLWQIIL